MRKEQERELQKKGQQVYEKKKARTKKERGKNEERISQEPT